MQIIRLLVAILIFSLSITTSILASPEVDKSNVRIAEFDHKFEVVRASPLVKLYLHRLKSLPPSKANDLSIWVGSTLDKTWRYQNVPTISAMLDPSAINPNVETLGYEIEVQDHVHWITKDFVFDQERQSDVHILGAVLSLEGNKRKEEIGTCQIGIVFDLDIYNKDQNSLTNTVKLIAGSLIPDKILNRSLMKARDAEVTGLIQADASSNEINLTLDWPLARNDAFAKGLFLKSNLEIERVRISIGNKPFSLFNLPQKHFVKIIRMPSGWFIDLTQIMQEIAKEGLDVDSAPSLKELTIQLARFHSAEQAVADETFDLSLQGIALEDAKYVFSNSLGEPLRLVDGKAEVIFPDLSHFGKVKASGGKLHVHSWLTSEKCSARLTSFLLQSHQLFQVPQYLQALETSLGFSMVRERLQYVPGDKLFIPKLAKYIPFNFPHPDVIGDVQNIKVLRLHEGENDIGWSDGSVQLVEVDQSSKISYSFSNKFYPNLAHRSEEPSDFFANETKQVDNTYTVVVKPPAGKDFQYVVLHSLVQRYKQNQPKQYKIQFDFNDGQKVLAFAKTNKPIDVWRLRREKGASPNVKSLKISIPTDDGDDRLLDGLFFYSPQLAQKKNIDANLLLPFKKGINDGDGFSLMSVEKFLGQGVVIAVGELEIPFKLFPQSNIHPTNKMPKDILLELADKEEGVGFSTSSAIFKPTSISLRPGESWSEEEWHDFITPSHWSSIKDGSVLVFVSSIAVAFIALAAAYYLRVEILRLLAFVEKTTREFVYSYQNVLSLAFHGLVLLIAVAMSLNALITNLSYSDLVVRALAVLCVIFGVLERTSQQTKSTSAVYVQHVSANLNSLLALAVVALSISSRTEFDIHNINYFTLALSIFVLAWRFGIIVTETIRQYHISVQALMLTVTLGVYYMAYIDELYTSMLRPLVDFLTAITLSYLIFLVSKIFREEKIKGFSQLLVNRHTSLFLTALLTGFCAITLHLIGLNDYAVVIARVTFAATLLGGLIDWFKFKASHELVRQEN